MFVILIKDCLVEYRGLELYLLEIESVV